MSFWLISNCNSEPNEKIFVRRIKDIYKFIPLSKKMIGLRIIILFWNCFCFFLMLVKKNNGKKWKKITFFVIMITVKVMIRFFALDGTISKDNHLDCCLSYQILSVGRTFSVSLLYRKVFLFEVYIKSFSVAKNEEFI